MNCAWCGAGNDGSNSHGICDACMSQYFSVDPASIQQEISDEQTAATSETFTEELEVVSA